MPEQRIFSDGDVGVGTALGLVVAAQ